MKHADILIWYASKELSVQVKHADILIRYARIIFLEHIKSNVIAGHHLYEKLLFTWLSLVMSLMLSLSPLDVLDEISQWAFWSLNDVVSTLMRRDDVASTLIRRHFGTKSSLGWDSIELVSESFPTYFSIYLLKNVRRFIC